VRPTVVQIPGGRYTMGRATIAEAEAPNPPHTVSVSPFAMGLHPVTNAEYRAYVEATGAPVPTSWSDERFANPRAPVVCVSWDDALAFCAWARGSLPTEAEWELAASGYGDRPYPWGTDEPDDRHAHFAQDWNSGGPCEVATHPHGIGPFGCHDLAGNVWEWCLDGWREDAHTVRANRLDPIVPSTSNLRPLRGGCWRSIAPKLQCAYRNWSHRVVRHITIGFRLSLRG
jgi:formylglycine-generating enzyme required for sulfatase activity